ncbi:MAG: RNA-binding protein, partial [Bacteroidales bacterium]|nr:RNA-binding protein [Bacteroidales bacterium]
MNIYIANLSVNVTDEDLRELFSPYGTINSVKVIIDKETGKSKGFG